MRKTKQKIIAMLENTYRFRVMYPDTDQMGTVHHSNYAKYYETARWELFRSIGITYKSVEDTGYILPVTRMSFRFRKTAHYDELLTVKTMLKNIKGARIWFTYKLFNANNELINEAETELACVCKKSWRPCLIPDFMLRAVEQSTKLEPAHA
jgi:acyl-CoA thioester hydrolase